MKFWKTRTTDFAQDEADDILDYEQKTKPKPSNFIDRGGPTVKHGSRRTPLTSKQYLSEQVFGPDCYPASRAGAFARGYVCVSGYISVACSG